MQHINDKNEHLYTEKDMIRILMQLAEARLFLTSKEKDGFVLYTLLGQSFYISCKEFTDCDSKSNCK